jgi:hypothetical protein
MKPLWFINIQSYEHAPVSLLLFVIYDKKTLKELQSIKI